MAMAVSARSPPESRESSCSALPGGCDYNFNSASQNVLAVFQPQFSSASAEKLFKSFSEISVYNGKLLPKLHFHFFSDVFNNPAEVPLGLAQILVLHGQAFKTLLGGDIFLYGVDVYIA